MICLNQFKKYQNGQIQLIQILQVKIIQQMTTQLTKPQFSKVKDLENARSGYNVYVKIISVDKSETQSKVPIIRAVVADQTGAANAFFKGDTAALIQEGKVIAIRNGTIKLIKSKISLEIDIFGRITPETVEIQASTENNISEKQIERRPRRNNDRREGDRPPRREGGEGDRRPRREGQGDRRPRREGQGDRRPRREGEQGDRRPRREGQGDRRPRREGQGDRRPRREGEQGDRRPRREGDFDRRPRRQGQGDRRPRREGDFDRRPRRQGDDNRGDRRPPTQFSKIAGVQPGDEGLNIFAKVLSVESVGKKARVVLGDETGIIRAFLYEGEHVRKGQTIVLFKAEAKVVKQHIELQVPREGKIDAARRKIEQVNEKVDVSAKEWVEANQ